MVDLVQTISRLSLMGAAFLVLAGCSDGAPDVEINAPIFNMVGENLMGKPAPAPVLADRAPLVMPPKNADLPPPGSGTQIAAASNGKQWPADPGDAKKNAEKAAAAEHERYCKEGNFGQAKNTDDFDKNTGKEVRCRPEWIENIMSIGDKKKS